MIAEALTLKARLVWLAVSVAALALLVVSIYTLGYARGVQSKSEEVGRLKADIAQIKEVQRERDIAAAIEARRYMENASLADLRWAAADAALRNHPVRVTRPDGLRNAACPGDGARGGLPQAETAERGLDADASERGPGAGRSSPIEIPFEQCEVRLNGAQRCAAQVMHLQDYIYTISGEDQGGVDGGS